jgi:hypothetical protein
MAAYTTIDNPELYFQVKLWTGTGSEIAATLDGSENMQPDLVAIKARTDAESHKVYDSVRGVTKHIEFDTSDAEATEAQGLKSFDSDGFTIGTYSSINASSSHTYVAWCWKESADAGFDIVSYAGTGSAHTEAHSLSAVPKMIIATNRERSSNWLVYHAGMDVTGNNTLFLDSTSAQDASQNYWNDTAPTSSVFSVGDRLENNYSSENIIAYAFAPKQGFSSMGSYLGNGNADGAFVYTGFRPAFVIQKRTDTTGNWVMTDTGRSPDNESHETLYPNLNNAEEGMGKDLLSNGFKCRTSDATINASGGTYIYMAFAEAPFVNSNGVPCNAR